MKPSEPDAVVVNDLEKRFGDFVAVDKVTFRVAKGDIFGLLGPNGAGKSTTIRMLCGIVLPTSGYGRVAGHDVFTEPEKIKQSIGYMSQKFSLYTDLSPFENIRFYLGVYSIPKTEWKERIAWVLELTRLQDVQSRLTRELPPGWRQRLALGCALIHRPEILFLDEPTSGVDPITRRHFWNFIGHLSEQGVTVFVTTHYMDEAENCRRIILINEGSVVADGTPAKIIEDTCPDLTGATLNDAFIRLAARKSR